MAKEKALVDDYIFNDLSRYYEKTFDELPRHLQKSVVRRFAGIGLENLKWDDLTPDERMGCALRADHNITLKQQEIMAKDFRRLIGHLTLDEIVKDISEQLLIKLKREVAVNRLRARKPGIGCPYNLARPANEFYDQFSIDDVNEVLNRKWTSMKPKLV